MGGLEKALDWIRRAWRWLVGLFRLNSRVAELERRVQRMPPRAMVPYKGIMVARRRVARDDDEPNEACCTFCFQAGVDSSCHVSNTRTGSKVAQCLNPAHRARRFEAILEARDYTWAMTKLDPECEVGTARDAR